MSIIEYKHHNKTVKVDSELQGKHHQHCLCWKCNKLFPTNEALNCPIANELFALCIRYSIVTPVYECPNFGEK